MTRKPWGNGGDSIRKRSRSSVLGSRYKGERHKITLGSLPNWSAPMRVAVKL